MDSVELGSTGDLGCCPRVEVLAGENWVGVVFAELEFQIEAVDNLGDLVG